MSEEEFLKLDDKQKYKEFDNLRKFTIYVANEYVANDGLKQDKEIERLNIIIEEIEQYCLDQQIPEEYPEYNDFTELFNSIYDTIYNKIQELKGSDK